MVTKIATNAIAKQTAPRRHSLDLQTLLLQVIRYIFHEIPRRYSRLSSSSSNLRIDIVTAEHLFDLHVFERAVEKSVRKQRLLTFDLYIAVSPKLSHRKKTLVYIESSPVCLSAIL